MADITPQEREEFEFRQRMEQEQGAAQQPTQTEQSLADKAADYVGTEFLVNTGLGAAGAIAGPGIKKEIELTGLPGMRPSSETAIKTPPSFKSPTEVAVQAIKNRTPSVTVEGVPAAVENYGRSQFVNPEGKGLYYGAGETGEYSGARKAAAEAIAAEKKFPGMKSIEGGKVPLSVPENIAKELKQLKEMEAAALASKNQSEINRVAQIRAERLKAIEDAYAAKNIKPGVIEGLKSAPMQTLGRGVGALGELANRIISPGFSQFGNHLIGGLGGLDVGLQGTQAVKHFGEGQIGRGLVSTLGALGGAGAMTRHPIVMPLGVGAAFAAPFINMKLEKIAEKYPQLHLAEGGAVHMAGGGMPNVSFSSNSLPSMNGMPGVGYMQTPQAAMARMQLEQELANQARLRAGATGMGMAIPGQQGVKMMPGNVEAGLNIPIGQGNVDISGYRSINPVNMPAQRGGHMQGANVRYTLPFAEGGEVKNKKTHGPLTKKELDLIHHLRETGQI